MKSSNERFFSRMEEKLSSKEGTDSSCLLIIFAGESGVGKSTFCRAMGLQDNWYVSSQAIVDALKQRGKPINHDTIHEFARDAYAENPRWQVPKILEAMKDKEFLCLDGPRTIKEVEALIEEHPFTLIVRIMVSDEDRFKRLQRRDGIDSEAFQRILSDESQQTGLNQILVLSDLTLENNGSIEHIQKQAVDFKNFISEILNKRRVK